MRTPAARDASGLPGGHARPLQDVARSQALDHEAVAMAVSEAVANTVVHPYGSPLSKG